MKHNILIRKHKLLGMKGLPEKISDIYMTETFIKVGLLLYIKLCKNYERLTASMPGQTCHAQGI